MAASVSHELDHEQVAKACRALLKHLESSKTAESSGSKPKRNLFDPDDEGLTDNPRLGERIDLQIGTKNVIVEKKKLKPKRMLVRHPVREQTAIECCLLVKDPADPIKEVVQSSAKLSKLITKIIPVSKLKGKYGSFEARRRLRDSYDIFLADDRIGTLLPGLLGSTFYEKAKSKIPLSIQIEKSRSIPKSQKLKNLLSSQPPKPVGEQFDVRTGPEKLEKEVVKALNSVYITLAPGLSSSVKIGHSGMNAKQLAENIADVVSALVGPAGERIGNTTGDHQANAIVPKSWDGLRSLHIKSAESVALPIWLTDDEPLPSKVEAKPEAQKKTPEKEAKLISNVPSSKKGVSSKRASQQNTRSTKRAKVAT